MIAPLALTLAVGAVVLAVWAVVGAVRAARPSGPQLLALAVWEVLLLVQAVVATVLLVRGGHSVNVPTFVGYIAASVALLPLGVLWGIADRSRWGNGVIAIACIALAVVVLRMLQVWA